MKKLLSIFTTFTAVSVVAPAVVSCKTDAATVESLTKEVAKNSEVVAKAKAYKATPTEDSKKTDLETEFKNKLEAEIKSKLKDKKEYEKVAELAKAKFTIVARIDGEKVKVKVTKPAWEESFAASDDKKADIKATYDSITGTDSEQEVSVA